MVPSFSAADIRAGDAETLARLATAAQDIGFLTVKDTGLTAARVRFVLAAYDAFFSLPESDKQKVNMALTGANRGWGAPQSEQVDPEANPDYKQVFDCGRPLPNDDPRANLPVYAPNLWPDLPGFQPVIEAYFKDAMVVAMDLLRGLAMAIGQDATYFDDKFNAPMALLRGNYYPERPGWAGDQDFGIAAHTDYGCLTLLATDGTPGLEVLARDGSWVPITVPPGEFVINFGEMLEIWTKGRVKATLHRVLGGSEARLSVPLFFNPNFDANVAPMGSSDTVLAGDHLSQRFAETYVHMQDAASSTE